MQSSFRNRHRIALAILAVLASGASLSGLAAAGQGDGPASCRIRAVREGDTIRLTALAEADAKVSGNYSLRVSGEGTDIRQDGAFQVAPGRTATLGTVTLGAGGASYEADLELDVAGKTIACSKRVGGGI